MYSTTIREMFERATVSDDPDRFMYWLIVFPAGTSQKLVADSDAGREMAEILVKFRAEPDGPFRSDGCYSVTVPFNPRAYIRGIVLLGEYVTTEEPLVYHVKATAEESPR